MKNLNVLVVCVLCLTAACKKKAIVDPQKSRSDDLRINGPVVDKGQWQGYKDQVDPKLGTLKSID